VKIRVDRERCSGHALCNFAAPELYAVDDEGYSALTELEVPLGLEERARRGASACPERAISIEN